MYYYIYILYHHVKGFLYLAYNDSLMSEIRDDTSQRHFKQMRPEDVFAFINFLLKLL